MLTFTSNESVPFIDVLCDTWLNAEKITRINYCRKTHYVCVHIIQTVWGKKKEYAKIVAEQRAAWLKSIICWFFFSTSLLKSSLYSYCRRNVWNVCMHLAQLDHSTIWGFFHYSHINCPFVQTVNDENCCNFFFVENFPFHLVWLDVFYYDFSLTRPWVIE